MEISNKATNIFLAFVDFNQCETLWFDDLRVFDSIFFLIILIEGSIRIHSNAHAIIPQGKATIKSE